MKRFKLWLERKRWRKESKREPNWMKEARRKQNYYDNWRAITEDKYL